MRKFNFNNYLFIHKKQQNIPKKVKSNVQLIPVFLNKSVQVYNGLNYFNIDEIKKKHLNYKIGTFINTRVTKKRN